MLWGAGSLLRDPCQCSLGWAVALWDGRGGHTRGENVGDGPGPGVSRGLVTCSLGGPSPSQQGLFLASAAAGASPHLSGLMGGWLHPLS